MELGIIAAPNEEGFKYAANKGLDFVEFCINASKDPTNTDRSNVTAFCSDLDQIRKWSEKYKVGVGSVGRWCAVRIKNDGSIDEDEMKATLMLMDAAAALGSKVFVCGCNEVKELSYYTNCTMAIKIFERMMEHAESKNIRLAIYNCRNNNFVCNPEAWKIIHGHLPALGIKYDPSHSIYGGGDYLTEMTAWGDRFFHVHIKGSLRINGQRFDDPPAGFDETNWNTFMAVLHVKGYNAGLSIEPHSKRWSGELGDKGLDYTIDLMRKLMLK